MPPRKSHALHMIAEGNMVAVQGHGENVTRDGRKYQNTYCWVFAFRNGSVRAVTEYADTELMRSVLGEPQQHRETRVLPGLNRCDERDAIIDRVQYKGRQQRSIADGQYSRNDAQDHPVAELEPPGRSAAKADAVQKPENQGAGRDSERDGPALPQPVQQQSPAKNLFRGRCEDHDKNEEKRQRRARAMQENQATYQPKPFYEHLMKE